MQTVSYPYPERATGSCSDVSDEFLARKTAESDMSAFEELMKKYEKSIFSLALKITGNRENAEEVAQDVFINVFRHIKNFKYNSSFKTWLYRIAVNAALMKLRENKKDSDNISEDALDDNFNISAVSLPDTPESTYEKEEFSAFVRKAVENLPEKYKTTFILKDIEGFSYQEIADILGLSLPAVKSRGLRARFKVRDFLGGYMKEAGRE